MNFEIKATNMFIKQIKNLDKKSRHIIHEKIQLIKENPFRYKRIHSKLFRRVFRVRFSINKKETRLIYVLLQPKIIIACLIDRKKDYKNLESFLKKILQEVK